MRDALTGKWLWTFFFWRVVLNVLKLTGMHSKFAEFRTLILT
jgi:hypothetical protein